MSPRPRTVPDTAILAAAARVVSRLGPAHLTLADVGREVGLSAATLVQRFGSKRGLLLAVAGTQAADVAREFAAARAAHRQPLAALVAALVSLSAWAATPEMLSNHLAFLQIDLTDPEFHRYALAHARTTRTEIAHLLEEAVAAGELVRCDAARLARAVEGTYNGALVTWAIYREGPVADWLRDELEALLTPYRTPRPRASRTTSRSRLPPGARKPRAPR
jgi:AcrR family transcriptional regulator